MAELKDRIEEILSRGMSYQEFIDKVNAVSIPGAAKLNKSLVANLVNGDRKPNYLTIVRIAKAFDVSVDYLLGLSDVPATIDDDINTAAKTTGLSIDCIKALQYLKNVTAETRNNIALTIEKYTIEAAEYVERDKEDLAAYLKKDVRDLPPFDWDDCPDAYVLFNLLYQLNNAPFLDDGEISYLLDGKRSSIHADDNLLFSVRHLAVMNYINEEICTSFERHAIEARRASKQRKLERAEEEENDENE